jgi:hypothetical protein
VAVVLAAVFLTAGIGWLARTIGSARTASPRMRTVGFAADCVMSLGMALMAGLMI